MIVTQAISLRASAGTSLLGSADILSASGRSTLRSWWKDQFGKFALRAQADRMSAIRPDPSQLIKHHFIDVAPAPFFAGLK
jgi:hypothetical protein